MSASCQEERAKPAAVIEEHRMTEQAALPDDIARQIADPRSYAEWDDLHRTLTRVRRDYPFARAKAIQSATTMPRPQRR